MGSNPIRRTTHKIYVRRIATRNQKDKGQYSEAVVLCEFQKHNIPVCVPWGDNERYDLIAEFNNKLNRIQIKTCNEEHNGSICCYCRTVSMQSNKHKSRTYDGQIDYFVFVNHSYNLIALVPFEATKGKTRIYLRLSPPSNNQTKNVKYFKDFAFDKTIKTKI